MKKGHLYEYDPEGRCPGCGNVSARIVYKRGLFSGEYLRCVCACGCVVRMRTFENQRPRGLTKGRVDERDVPE